MNKIALIDCNNFYVSCERVFDPKLKLSNVLVLSNNDACVISRSNEVKKMGIKMGDPYFKIKSLCQWGGVIAKSSNLALYGDMSKRVMSVVTSYSPKHEVYSIDEAFLEFDNPSSIITEMKTCQKQVLKSTGIPVSIGIGGNKTLAKLANKIAKDNPKHSGVFDISDTDKKGFISILKSTNISDIWGIGSSSSKKLNSIGILNSFDFFSFDRNSIQNLLGLSGLKVFDELHGKYCIEMEYIKKKRNQISSSRTFGQVISKSNDLKQAITSMSRQAITKLRKEGLHASKIKIFASSNPHDVEPTILSEYITLSFPSCEFSLIPIISAKVDTLFKDGVLFYKGGVEFLDLTSSFKQQDLFSCESGNSNNLSGELTNSPNELKSMEIITKKYGNKIHYAGEFGSNIHKSKADYKSPSFTTNWNDILVVK